MTFTFGDHVLDVDLRELRRGSQPVALEPLVFDLLLYLVRNRARVVAKDELNARIWGGRIVSESAITTCLNAARKAVGDDGAAQRLIRTVPRRGVRFIGDVIEADAIVAAGPSPAMPEAMPATLTDGPSIAVLPFHNLSSDATQDYFVDGMVEEIITALCRIRWLLVIARNSSFVYKGLAVDGKLVGRQLGVRYVLEGSVRKAGAQVRITAQLIDAMTGAHVWADRFDALLQNVFDLQDKVASAVAGVIEPAMQVAETARTAGRPTNDLTAYDLYLQSYALYFSSAARIPEALQLLEQAIARDPCYGPALAWAAVCCFRLVGQRNESREANARRCIDLARRALELGHDDPRTMAGCALALGYFDEDIGAMMALVDRALTLNPSFAFGWRVSGALRLWAGQPDVAIEQVGTALRLDPRARVNRSYFLIGAAHFLCRRFDEAVPKLLVAIQDDPGAAAPYRFLAACYAHMGRLPESRDIVRRLRAIGSDVMSDFRHLRNAEHRAFTLSGLRMAAGEAA